ncbi:MAG: GlsB/YeaQ/YmgE family stress response membrane protein [Sphingomonadales bacterium]|nr:MAG: GlsB/YeaQ/YmgE family stress response membrane protein [Sphingomonadales bacterium]
MGLVIVIVVGAILGWLASIVVDRDDRAGAAICALAGTVGSVVAAVLAGDVPLVIGVSAPQLLWGVVGAVLAIVAINAAVVTRLGSQAGHA